MILRTTILGARITSGRTKLAPMLVLTDAMKYEYAGLVEVVVVSDEMDADTTCLYMSTSPI